MGALCRPALCPTAPSMHQNACRRLGSVSAYRRSSMSCLQCQTSLDLRFPDISPLPISCQVICCPGGRARPGPQRSLYQIWVVCPTWRIGKVSYWSTCTIARIRVWASREWAKPQACVHMTLPPHSSSSTWLMCRMAGRFSSVAVLFTHSFWQAFLYSHRSVHFNPQHQPLSYWGELEPVLMIAVIAHVLELYWIFSLLLFSHGFVLLYRFVIFRKHQTIQKHMSRLGEKPRLYEVDPDCLVWTPAKSGYRKPSESQHRIGVEVDIIPIASSLCSDLFIFL